MSDMSERKFRYAIIVMILLAGGAFVLGKYLDSRTDKRNEKERAQERSAIEEELRETVLAKETTEQRLEEMIREIEGISRERDAFEKIASARPRTITRIVPAEPIEIPCDPGEPPGANCVLEGEAWVCTSIIEGEEVIVEVPIEKDVPVLPYADTVTLKTSLGNIAVLGRVCAKHAVTGKEFGCAPLDRQFSNVYTVLEEKPRLSRHAVTLGAAHFFTPDEDKTGAFADYDFKFGKDRSWHIRAGASAVRIQSVIDFQAYTNETVADVRLGIGKSF